METKPSLDYLRSVTDELVLRALMGAPRLTRAEVATAAGISKPTASESVRRLLAAGLVHDTGERTTGRGRVGTYYGLAPDAGCALVLDIAPLGIVAELVDARGTTLARSVRAVDRPAVPAEVAAALRSAATEAVDAARGPVRAGVASAADPVDRRSGRLRELPDTPFLVGDLDPAAVLDGLVEGPVVVDNDVNWAACAERDAARGDASRPPADFAYLYLGEGLGCAVVADGDVRRGHAGLAGEIAHVLTVGPSGRATLFTEVFAELGLHRAGSRAIDADAVARTADKASGLRALAAAIAGVVAAVVAMADPEVVVVGGTWGADPRVLRAAADAVERSPRPVPLRAAQVSDAPLRG
ncbi:MAG: ROK family transcriptional regulator, partial [Microbacterium sp.]|uniref:ROK family transcriptional regulator n=1 Tax=Microbacterium sp. TaxID=51671 RepID=UPI0039E36DCE